MKNIGMIEQKIDGPGVFDGEIIMCNQKISNLSKCTSNYCCKKNHRHPSYYNDEN